MNIALSENTAIMLFNGHIKRSQDIVVGDTLIGDDGTMRTVLEISKGEDLMYEINQTNGISYTINNSHKLILINKTEIIEVTVDEYFNISNKNDYKGFKPNSSIESDISIKSIGYGKYYSWQLDKNNRFILPDKTII